MCGSEALNFNSLKGVTMNFYLVMTVSKYYCTEENKTKTTFNAVVYLAQPQKDTSPHLILNVWRTKADKLRN